MRYLLDTCVFSELSRPVPDRRVSRFLEEADDEELRMSVITVGELVKGVEALPPGKRRDGLEIWVNNAQEDFTGRLWLSTLIPAGSGVSFQDACERRESSLAS